MTNKTDTRQEHDMSYTLHVNYKGTLTAYQDLPDLEAVHQILAYQRRILVVYKGASVESIHVGIFGPDGEPAESLNVFTPGGNALYPETKKMQNLVERAIELQLDDSFYGTVIMDASSLP